MLVAYIQGKPQPSVICTVDELEEKVKPLFSKVIENGGSSTLSVNILIDEKASVGEIVKMRELLRKVNNGLDLNASLEEKKFRLTSKQDCYPVVLKLHSLNGSREVECNDATSVLNVDLADTEKVTIVASNKCKMGFIFDLRNMLTGKHPKLSIDYASI